MDAQRSTNVLACQVLRAWGEAGGLALEGRNLVLEEKVMAVAYSLWESHSTGVSFEAENRTGWGTLQPQKFMAVFSHPARFRPGRT
jgi:hypothetical protein